MGQWDKWDKWDMGQKSNYELRISNYELKTNYVLKTKNYKSGRLGDAWLSGYYWSFLALCACGLFGLGRRRMRALGRCRTSICRGCRTLPDARSSRFVIRGRRMPSRRANEFSRN